MVLWGRGISNLKIGGGIASDKKYRVMAFLSHSKCIRSTLTGDVFTFLKTTGYMGKQQILHYQYISGENCCCCCSNRIHDFLLRFH